VIKLRKMRWARYVERLLDMRKVSKVCDGKPEGKKPLGRSKCRCGDNIKMDIKGTNCNNAD
jgi:hypothetical protein